LASEAATLTAKNAKDKARAARKNLLAPWRLGVSLLFLSANAASLRANIEK
jgi:hypothetical protein